MGWGFCVHVAVGAIVDGLVDCGPIGLKKKETKIKQIKPPGKEDNIAEPRRSSMSGRETNDNVDTKPFMFEIPPAPAVCSAHWQQPAPHARGVMRPTTISN